MSRRLTMASVTHEQPALAGTFTWDGEVFEAFGFNEVHSVRVPAELIESVELDLESGMLKTPSLTVRARGGCLGLHQGFEPDPGEIPALEALVSEIQASLGAA